METKKGYSKYFATNKKAYFNYFISDELECGISLLGSEVKSILKGHISIIESFIKIKNGEMFLKNCYIKTYESTGSFIPDERRDRKLLLHKNQIARFQKKVEVDGFTIIPIKVVLSATNKIKIIIALGKGKKLYDKRETLKKRSIERSLDRFRKF